MRHINLWKCVLIDLLYCARFVRIGQKTFKLIFIFIATGGSTTVYAVNEYGDPNEIIVADTEEQYLIKWKGWAHLHNTWESEATLKENKVQGLKKLQNYMAKLEQIAVWLVLFVIGF